MSDRLVVQTGQVRPRGLLGSVQAMMYRMAYAVGLGQGFNGARNYYATFGYNLTPKHSDFVAKYLRQDIATRVIKAPVDALWTDFPTVDGGSRFTKAWNTLVYEQDVYKWLRQADIFAGLGMYSILLIGFDDGRALDQPVNTSRTNKVTFLQPYLEGSVEIDAIEVDSSNPRYGLPTRYKVTPGYSLIRTATVMANKSPAPFIVHYSRVLHLADNALENAVVGHSRLEPIYNVLDDILKVVGGASETYWLTSNRGMQVDVDKDLELEEEDADNLAAEIDEYSNGLRRVMRTRGVKINSLGSDVADPRGVFNALIALLSSNTGIPQRVLMGAEAGQLASQQDRANWAVQVAQRIKNWGEPTVIKPFIQTLTSANALPSPTKEISYVWPEPFKMNPLERGQTSAQQARSITNVSRAMDTAQKMGVDLISVEEAREMTAPGENLLVLSGTPTGKFPPKLKAPYNDPQNKLDEIKAQGEVAAEAAERAAKAAAENPAPQPFGGGNAAAE